MMRNKRYQPSDNKSYYVYIQYKPANGVATIRIYP